MDLLRKSGYRVIPIETLIREGVTDQKFKEILDALPERNLLLCAKSYKKPPTPPYNVEKLMPWADFKVYVLARFSGSLEDSVKYFKDGNILFSVCDILNSKKWENFYNVLGTVLFKYMLIDCVICLEIRRGVIVALTDVNALTLDKKSVTTNVRETSDSKNPKDKLSSKKSNDPLFKENYGTCTKVVKSVSYAYSKSDCSSNQDGSIGKESQSKHKPCDCKVPQKINRKRAAEAASPTGTKRFKLSGQEQETRSQQAGRPAQVDSSKEALPAKEHVERQGATGVEKKQPAAGTEKITRSDSKPKECFRYDQVINLSFLYSNNTCEKWPAHHILSKCNADEEGALSLLRQVLSQDVGCGRAEFVDEEKVIAQCSDLQGILREFIKSHKHFHYQESLKYHVKHTRKINPEVESTKHYVEWKTIFSFLRAIDKNIICSELFGSEENHQIFLDVLKKLTRATKGQTFTLDQLMVGIRISKCKWLKKVDGNVRGVVFAKVFLWLLENYIFIILRTFLYVTETGLEKNKLVFYPKSNWAKVREQSLKAMVSEERLKKLSEKQDKGFKKNEKKIERGRLRFIPKKHGVRPIIKSTRKIDNNLLEAQQFLLAINRENQFASIGKELLSKWQEFKAAWENEGRPNLFFVRTDITDAYGSVNHERILKRLGRVLMDPEKVTLRKVKVTNGQGRNRFQMVQAKSSENIRWTFPNNCIIQDTGELKTYSKGKIIKKIQFYIQNQIVNFGRRAYLLRKGVTQGGKLSALLCDFYYGNIDNSILKRLVEENDLLLRSVDDYIYISSKRENAVRFFETLNSLREYNIFVNSNKTQSNILARMEHQTHFTFCGSSFDIRTLEVGGDYSPYVGVDIRNCVTFSCTSHPGRFLERHMGMIYTLKLHNIHLCENLNSVEKVIQNIYYAALMLAFRFHAIIRELFSKTTLNPSFLLKQIENASMNIFHHIQTVKKNNDIKNTVTRLQTQFLTYKAFYYKLARSSALYQKVLKKLKSLVKLSVPSQDVLVEITKDGLPEIFKKIK